MALLSRNASLVAAGWAAAFGAAVVVGGSCLIPDDSHCAHNNGDAFCSGSTPYCNGCLSAEDNLGCVADKPEDNCYTPGDEPYVEGGSTSTGPMTTTGDDATDDGGSSSTGPTDCTAEGERDDACPDSAPFCLDGVCAGCDEAGGDEFCDGLDSTLPVCGEAGDCVECSVDNTERCVGDTPFCFLGSCSGCYDHSLCGDYGCDLFTGRCMDESNGGVLAWVEGPECTPEEGFGTEEEPYCNLDTVQENIDNGMSMMTIRVKAPGVFSTSVTASADEVVALIGYDGIPEVGDTSAVQAVNGGRVYVQNARLEGSSETSVRCNTMGKVWIRDAQITGNGGGNGLQLDPGCEAVVERSIVALNDLGGIEMDRADVKLYSSAVMANGDDAMETYGIRLSGGTFEASHITVITNNGNGAGRNIACIDGDGGLPEVSIRNSIVMHPEDVSFVGCDDISIVNSAVDDDLFESEEDGVIDVAYQASYFASPTFSDPHLQAGTPFNDVARWQTGDPLVDLDGEDFNTTPGAGNFAGCDERQ